MQLLIKNLSGKTIVIDAEPYNTILDIKNIIQERENIPSDKIRLTNLSISDLEDNKTFKDYKISNYSLLEIKFKTRNNFYITIYINNQESQKFSIYLSLYDTIYKMKEIIEIKESISKNLQILKLGEIILENETKRLKDYKIKNGDIIQLKINKKISINLIIDNEKEILINVKSLDYIKIIRNNQNIITLKEKEHYIFYFKNNQLDENKAFLDYNIKEGDTIHFKKIINNENQKSLEHNIEEGNNIDFNKNINKNDNMELEGKINNLEKLNKSLLEKIDKMEKKLKEMTMKNQELINKNKELYNLLTELKNKNIIFSSLIFLNITY